MPPQPPPTITPQYSFFTTCLISRLVLLAAYALLYLLIPLPPHLDPSLPTLDPDYRSLPFTSDPVKKTLGAFHVWDGVHYLRLSSTRGSLPSDIAFFPLYPFLISLFSPLFGATISGLAVNCLGYAASGHVLLLYTRRYVTASPPFMQALQLVYLLSPCNVFYTCIAVEGVQQSVMYTLFYVLRRREEGGRRGLAWDTAGVVLCVLAGLVKSTAAVTACLAVAAHSFASGWRRWRDPSGSLRNWAACRAPVDLAHISATCAAVWAVDQRSRSIHCGVSTAPVSLCGPGWVYKNAQSELWDTGYPFSYWRVRNLPHFALAGCTVYFVAVGVKTWLQCFIKKVEEKLGEGKAMTAKGAGEGQRGRKVRPPTRSEGDESEKIVSWVPF